MDLRIISKSMSHTPSVPSLPRSSALQLPWQASAITAIEQTICPVWADFMVEVLPCIDSTNTELMRRGRAGHVRPTLLVAEQQTAGKGRMGRQWHTQAAGDSLIFSLGLPLGGCDLSGLSIVVGLSLVQALDAENTQQLQVKWPNDLWYQQRKLGGILIEVCGQGAQRYAVIGVGINIKQPNIAPTNTATPNTNMRPQTPAWVQEFAPQAAVQQVLQQVAEPLAQAVQQFAQHGFAPWQATFASRDGLAGQAVWLSDNTTGTAIGINAKGAFLVKSQGVLREIYSEEISVRPAQQA